MSRKAVLRCDYVAGDRVALAVVSLLRSAAAPVPGVHRYFRAAHDGHGQWLATMRRWRVSTARRGYRTPRGSFRPHRAASACTIRANTRIRRCRIRSSSSGGYAIHGTGYVSARPAGVAWLHQAAPAQCRDALQAGAQLRLRRTRIASALARSRLRIVVSNAPEDAAEDRIDMLGVVAEVEERLEFARRSACRSRPCRP